MNAEHLREKPGLRVGLANEILRVEDLKKVFRTQGSFTGRGREEVRAVDGVSFDLARGETLGLVGESGCGKSTIARCVLRLSEPSGGRVVFDGVEVGELEREDLRRLRRRMQIVFQDPYASLDPRMSVAASIDEPLRIHGIKDRAMRNEQVREILALVGISAEQATRKPHAFSGGQRQRIALARALVLRPDLVILDEPVTALDVSIQAQVLNLLRELQDQLDLTFLFIVHDLAVAEYFCHRLAVLYLGSVVELADRNTLFASPLHPYTSALFSAAPVPEVGGSSRRERIVLKGDISNATAAAIGCRFEPRCPVGHGREICRSVRPPLQRHGADHWAACHFPGELPAGTPVQP